MNVSQRRFKATANGKQVEVQIGWDRPLHRFYMCIFEIDENGDDIDTMYSNLNEPNPDVLSVEYFTGVARKYGVEVPVDVIAQVKQDKFNNV